jgi:hypothetical protein
MKVKIYINEDECSVSEYLPRVLTEKQYQEKTKELIKDRMDNLKYDDGFVEHLADKDYTMSQVFFLSEEEKAKLIKEFEPYVVDSAKDELKDYYAEYEIEI